MARFSGKNTACLLVSWQFKKNLQNFSQAMLAAANACAPKIMLEF
jgi:hypothetical protein